MMTGPESTPALPADVAAMSPEQARSEIDRIRGDAAHAWAQPLHRQHAAAQDRMAALYARVYPAADDDQAAATSAPTPPGGPAAEEEPPGAEPGTTVEAAALPPGYTWDAPTLTAVRNLIQAEEIDPRLGSEGEALVSRLLHERAPTLTAEEAEDTMYERWGSWAEPKFRWAGEVWALLPAKVRGDLEATGLKHHPEVIELLARIGESRWDATTDAGLRRLKARSLAALEVEAKKAAP